MTQSKDDLAKEYHQPVAYHYSASEKLRLFLPLIRQKLRPKKYLLAGPFAGEFGWELMQWQGFVRSRRPYYEEVHVLTYPGREYLYEKCVVHTHAIDLKNAGYGYGLLAPSEATRVAIEKANEIGLSDYDIFDTSLLCTRYHKVCWRQNFRLFEEQPSTNTQHDVIFHFRAVNKKGPDQNKNYSTALADQLVKLCLDNGLNVACIGHPSYAYCPPECSDFRNVDLKQTVAAISSARIVAGENSGPMHLANLCGKSTVIWAQDQWRVDYSLRWNPFQVPIFVVSNETCQPTPQLVCDKLIAALEILRRKTDNFRLPVYILPARQIVGY